MPRRNPVQDTPYRKSHTSFKFERNFDNCCSVPCTYNRCGGFMFLVTASYGEDTPVVDELECFVCKKIKRLGTHDPNRSKPKPFPPRDKRR